VNNDFEKYLEDIKIKYAESVKVIPSEKKLELLKKIPDLLHPVYDIISSLELPFGQIFTIEEALKQSQKLPYKPDWFVFGKDKYFSFWICLFNKDEDGLSFTYWDHESGNEIDGAAWEDIVSFLEELEENYNS